MPDGKRKDARFDLRLNADLVSRLEQWLTENPSVKNKTHAMEIALNALIDGPKSGVIILTEEQRKILNDYRRKIDDIPEMKDVIDQLIKSLKED